MPTCVVPWGTISSILGFEDPDRPRQDLAKLTCQVENVEKELGSRHTMFAEPEESIIDFLKKFAAECAVTQIPALAKKLQAVYCWHAAKFDQDVVEMSYWYDVIYDEN